MIFSDEIYTLQNRANWPIIIWVSVEIIFFLATGFFYSTILFSVQEIRYEKLAPQLDANTLNESTELKFTIQPNTDYFTRFTPIFVVIVLEINSYLFYQPVSAPSSNWF